jgi:hypothetical protein
MRRRLLGIVALLFCVVALAATPASAIPITPNPCSSYPPVCPTIRLSKIVLHRSEQFTVFIDNFQPNSSEVITMESSPVTLGTITVNSVGSGTLLATIPANFDLGSHTVFATGPNQDPRIVTVGTGLTVIADTAVLGESLSRTGAQIGMYTLIGFGLLGLGALLVAATRRRRNTATP